MARIWLVVTLLVRVSANARQSRELVASLRSQLMSNNYDYMEESAGIELTTENIQHLDFNTAPYLRVPAFDDLPERRFNHDDDVDAKRRNDEAMSQLQKTYNFPQNFQTHSDTAPQSRRGLNVSVKVPSYPNQQVYEMKTSKMTFDLQMTEDPIDQNLVDGSSLEATDLENIIDNVKSDTEIERDRKRKESVAADRSAATTAPRFRLLQLKNPSRRSADGRRFLQAERSDGVEIFPLEPNSGPFPDFRLPSERRQYMTDIETEENLEPAGRLNRAPEPHPEPPLPVDDPDVDSRGLDLRENLLYK